MHFVKRSWIIKGSWALGSVVFSLLLVEFVVFRLILAASDIPKIEFVDGVVKYVPNQSGVTRIASEIVASWQINADGWNSRYEDYEEERSPDTFRIAIIGDSYVDAQTVGYQESLAEQLEDMLGRVPVEVYRFGLSGSPMSQYLHVLRNDVLRYQPDLVVVNLVQNDFTESYRYEQGVYASSFLKLTVEDGVVVDEVAPERYERSWYSGIREGSATWRYLRYNRGVRFQFLRDRILGEEPERERDVDGGRARPQARRAADEAVTEYVFAKLKELTSEHDAELLLVMDGDRNDIYRAYENGLSSETETSELNAMAARVADTNDIHFIDMHPVFDQAFRERQEKFNFESDYHWNSRGHQVAAETIWRYIQDKQLLSVELAVQPATGNGDG